MAAVPSLGRATEVERSSAAEADATSALYERYSGPLYTFCLHKLGSREEAEDAVQSTFLNAFRGLQRGVVPAAESAWLFKIAENVCLTRNRSAWRRGRVESPSDIQALQDFVPARERPGDELIPLGDALATMPESQQRALLMREWQGLSYREIAEEMGVSQSAVETLIFRARRSLASALETPWKDRRARKAGRRAFDLGSLLAGLKTFLAGSTAAKVAIVALAATGTATVAVAERHSGGLLGGSKEPSAPVLPSPASSNERPAVTGATARWDTREAVDPRRSTGPADRTTEQKAGPTKAKVSGASATASESAVKAKGHPARPAHSQRPETPAGQAKARPTHPVHPAHPTQSAKAKTKPQTQAASAEKVEKPKAEKPKAEQPKEPREPKAPSEPKPENTGPPAQAAQGNSGDEPAKEKDK